MISKNRKIIAFNVVLRLEKSIGRILLSTKNVVGADR
jgi:hypothetical protein